ncbi:MAG: TolC family protein [Rickettsiaceae bacterium]|nr:TolC family protein [Rickettsiaceae bacterium]
MLNNCKLKLAVTSVLLALLLNAKVSFAVVLEEALKSAILSNEKFKILQESFLQSSEQVPRAISDAFMPKTAISSSIIKNDKTSLGTTSNQQQLSNSIQTTLPVFSGGAGLASLKTSHNIVMAAKYQYYKDEQNTIINLINLYIDYHVANEIYKIRKASTLNAKQNYEAAKEKVILGEATKTDLAFAESSFSKAKTEELKSLTEKENKYQEFAVNFNMSPEETILPRVDSKQFEDLDFFTNKVQKQNLDLKIYSYNLQSASSNVSATLASSFSPTVSLTASSGTKARVGSMRFNNFGNQDPTIQLNINIPLLSRGGQEFADVRTSRSKERAVALTLASLQKSVQTSITSSLSNYKTFKLSIESAKAAVDARELYLKGVEQEYGLGNKSLLDLLQADSDLANDKITYVQTVSAYIKSFYALKSLVGELTAKKMRLGIKVFDPEVVYTRKKIGFITF